MRILPNHPYFRNDPQNFSTELPVLADHKDEINLGRQVVH